MNSCTSSHLWTKLNAYLQLTSNTHVKAFDLVMNNSTKFHCWYVPPRIQKNKNLDMKNKNTEEFLTHTKIILKGRTCGVTIFGLSHGGVLDGEDSPCTGFASDQARLRRWLGLAYRTSLRRARRNGRDREHGGCERREWGFVRMVFWGRKRFWR